MSREPRQQAPPEPGTSAAGGRDGLPPADMRADAGAVDGFPGSALGDGYQPAAVSGDALGPQTGLPPAERPSRPSRGTGVRPRRPSLGGGIPAQGRELGAQGRQTVRRLLEAGPAEVDQRGLPGVGVADAVRPARTAPGTFYLYFANTGHSVTAPLPGALRDIETLT